MSKPCRNCGAQLPDEASFCPYCETAQTEKVPAKSPGPWKRKALWTACALAVAAVVGGGLFLAARTPAEPAAPSPTISASTDTPEPYQPQVFDEGGAEVHYQGYTLLLVYQDRDGESRTPCEYGSCTLAPGMGISVPSQLYLYQEDGSSGGEAFLELLDRVEVTTTALDDRQAMECSTPHWDEHFAQAVLMTDVFINDACGTNQILWTLHMKNGDTLLLRQTMEAILQSAVVYTDADAPMNTTEDLQALLEQIAREVDEDTVVTLELPPLCYDGVLEIKDRAVNLRGTTDGDAGTQTTFTGGVVLHAETTQLSQIDQVNFIGNGGVGLDATWSVRVSGCTFTGWDIAISATEQAWVIAYGNSFRKNGIAIKMDSYQALYTNLDYSGCEFRDNDVGLWFARMPGGGVLCFPNSVFGGNGTDIVNDTTYGIDLSGATME